MILQCRTDVQYITQYDAIHRMKYDKTSQDVVRIGNNTQDEHIVRFHTVLSDWSENT